MNWKKLQALISAGVFSTALMSGAAYAEDKSDDSNQVVVSTPTPDTSDQGGQAAAPDSKKKTTAKSGSDMGCSSPNGCGNH